MLLYKDKSLAIQIEVLLVCTVLTSLAGIMQTSSCSNFSQNDQAEQYCELKSSEDSKHRQSPVSEPKEGQVKITERTRGTYFHFMLNSLYIRNLWYFFIQKIL